MKAPVPVTRGMDRAWDSAWIRGPRCSRAWPALFWGAASEGIVPGGVPTGVGQMPAAGKASAVRSWKGASLRCAGVDRETRTAQLRAAAHSCVLMETPAMGPDAQGSGKREGAQLPV